MNTKETVYDILNGPNKDILFDACKYAYNKHANIEVLFKVAKGYTTPPTNPNCAYIQMSVTDIMICGIEHEDGSGDSFNLHGYCNTNSDFSGSTGEGSMVYKPCKFMAYYNTKTRKGHISFRR